MDVVSIEKSGEHFRILYDVKGSFTIHRISAEEATYKLAKVKKVQLGPKGVPYVVTHDGRTVRYPDPAIRVNDTIKFDFAQNKITEHLKFETGNIVMVTGGRSVSSPRLLATFSRLASFLTHPFPSSSPQQHGSCRSHRLARASPRRLRRSSFPRPRSAFSERLDLTSYPRFSRSSTFRTSSAEPSPLVFPTSSSLARDPRPLSPSPRAREPRFVFPTLLALLLSVP